MGRLEDKLARAAGVAARIEKVIEDNADKLIAREDELMARQTKAFAVHHQHMDAQHKSMDRLEDAIQIIDNGAPPDPLPATGQLAQAVSAGAGVPATPTFQNAEATPNPVEPFQPTH